jgi:hypothetical protein
MARILPLSEAGAAAEAKAMHERNGHANSGAA